MPSLGTYIVSEQNKEKYGEVQTDIKLINMILDTIPREKYRDPDNIWLDFACGHGGFMVELKRRLLVSLEDAIPNLLTREKHIVEHMIHMVEVNKEHIPHLRTLFGEKANIHHADFLSFEPNITFDIIIGNPPFNINGNIKVPTNTTRNKKNDGKTIWTHFLRHSLHLLRDGGSLAVITPSLWMKPDKARIYDLLTSFRLEKIRCFTNTETNQIFHGHAQTPTCFFSLTKKPPKTTISLYDKCLRRYIPYLFSPTTPIPVFAASIFSKLQPYLAQVGHPRIIKTSMPSKRIVLSKTPTNDCSYCNVRTCIIKKQKPSLVFEYSNKPLPFYNKPKLILAHKMYGFPYYDKEGEYGISRRDNYVLVDQSNEHFKIWGAFLSTKFAIYLFEGTRYRMKYLEKYVFELIPDITKLEGFPRANITDETIADYFQLSDIERKAVQSLTASGKIALEKGNQNKVTKKT